MLLLPAPLFGSVRVRSSPQANKKRGEHQTIPRPLLLWYCLHAVCCARREVKRVCDSVRGYCAPLATPAHVRRGCVSFALTHSSSQRGLRGTWAVAAPPSPLRPPLTLLSVHFCPPVASTPQPPRTASMHVASIHRMHPVQCADTSPPLTLRTRSPSPPSPTSCVVNVCLSDWRVPASASSTYTHVDSSRGAERRPSRIVLTG